MDNRTGAAEVEPRLRFVRLVSREEGARMFRDRAYLAGWLARHVPRDVSLAERWIWPVADHATLADRFEEFFREVGRAALPRYRAQRLLVIGMEQAAGYDAWRAAGCPDAAYVDQVAQGRLAKEAPSLAAAARLLAKHLRSARGMCGIPLSLARLRAAETINLHDPIEGEHFEGMRALFENWKHEEGEPYGAPLSRLLDAFADELAAWTPGGPEAFQRGPWLFPGRVDGRRALPTPETAAAFLATALARGAGMDWPLAMPAHGKAHWALAAAFARGLTGSPLEPRDAREQVARVMRRNRGLRFRGWPTSEGDASAAFAR
jgi:hypothetical protein